MKLKMTKLICLLFVMILLTSCGKMGRNSDSQEAYREISEFANICFTDTVTGEFYFDDNEATHFVDYNSLNDVYLCPKPNCTHTPNNTHTHTESTCSAYDLGYKPCLYGNKLYYMTNEVKMKDNSPVISISMRCADIDGTNRKSITELDGYWTSGSRDYLVSDKLYFTAAYKKLDNSDIELENGSVQYEEGGIWCYDFSTNTFELIYDHYNGSYNRISLIGYWQDRLYFSYSEIDEEKNALTGSRYVIDLSSGDVTEAERGFVAVSEEYLITLENDTLVLHKDKDTIIAAEGFEYEQYQSVYIVNGMLFSQKNSYCFDIEAGKCRKVTVPKNTTVRAYIDGNYILYSYDFDAQKPRYTKIPESKLIGTEIT